MKRLLLVLLLVPSLAHGVAHQVRVEQRNAADTAWGITTMANPPASTTGIFVWDGATGNIRWATPINGLTYDAVNRTISADPQSDWNLLSGPGSILNRPDLQTVALSGSYDDLINLPEFSAVALSGAYSDLSGLPTLFDGVYSSLAGIPSTFTPSSHTHPSTQISDSSAVGRSVMTATDQASARTAIGAGTSNFSGAYSSLTGIPSTFTPSAHTHDASDVVSGTLADARIPSLAISKTTGLQAALDGKFPNPSGATSQYIRGDGSLATLPTATFVAGSPTTRSVSLATAYQCTTTTRPCMVTITLQAQSSISLSGASNNEGQIVIGSTNAVASGTGTAIATYKNNLGGTLVIGLNLNSQQANTYSVMIPTGWYFAARQTAGSGLQVVSAFDQSMGN